MKQLILASNNKHKIEEIQSMLKDYQILTLEDIGFYDDIIEDGKTFEENALIKAKAISKFSGKDVISDDSGLMIDLLNGEPGVYSARYSEEGTSEKNIEKVLEKLAGKTSPAKFVSVIALVKTDGEEILFRGECKGEIITEPRGNDGFGYNPIFFVKEKGKTFAQLSLEERTAISHRRMSIDKLVNYLTKGELDEN